MTIRWYKRVGPIGAEAYAGLAGNEAQAEAQPERMGMGRSKDSVKRYVERVYAETASFSASESATMVEMRADDGGDRSESDEFETTSSS